MSLYDKASLVQIPSGTKSGTLYSVLPANGNGDFTHTRGSSATRVNKDGLIESVASGVPRLDYPLLDGVIQSCPALLLEPSRTNTIPYSNDFNQHSILGGSITSDDIVSPDGGVNADTFVEDTNSSQHRIREDISVSAGTYTMSCFVKGTDRFISLYPQSAGSAYAVFDIANEAITKTGGSDYVSSDIQNYGNGWYRCILTYTVSTGTSYLHIYLSNISTGTGAEAPTYTGNGSEMSFYGLQLEAGSYATSYIPTENNPSGVTRSADACNGAGTSAEFNDSEGVLFAEVAALDEAQGTSVITISDSSLSDRVLIAFVSGELRGEFVSTGGIHTRTSSGLVIENFNKIACSYTATTFKVFINGSQVLTTGTVTTPMSGIVELAFDRGDGGNDFYGNTKQLMVFNQALTDSELEQITSWRSFDEMATGQLYTIE